MRETIMKAAFIVMFVACVLTAGYFDGQVEMSKAVAVEMGVMK